MVPREKPQPVTNPAVGGMNRIDRGATGEDKFKGVMDWGTPRLVTKNRQLVMDQKTME